MQKLAEFSQGKTAQIGGGADVFIANLNNEYLGRICIWKVCKYGARMRCDADNCGKRKYLHDDLSVIKLSEELVDSPPLILFPKIVYNVSIPLDVEKGLINKIISSAI